MTRSMCVMIPLAPLVGFAFGIDRFGWKAVVAGLLLAILGVALEFAIGEAKLPTGDE